ncbi:methyltransferase family protein [Stackebrandtia endophytica]|uniref:Methyltransferase family protein n=1 Tax=Stackebrandtia endophytica TaxID=1496996 RepID=A0A543AUE3_9ACTN|nr:class I SAM-dependent methyltransferase [Stackebrandtia endophytica]TQL76198.1 methyltransferase family protein [Stackebrandtia endophytica]
MSFDDPLVADVYDPLNGTRDDLDLFRRLVERRQPKRVIDLGCGTGVLAVELAESGREVIGIDPAEAMLAIARNRPGGDRVRWIRGDATAIDVIDVDMAILTAHSAQEIIEDTEWDATLSALRAAMRSGGVLAFDNLDPRARAWESWRPDRVGRRELPGYGVVEFWHRVDEFTDGVVHMESGFRVPSLGEERLIAGKMRFRTREELTESLERAGFAVEAMYADHNGRPVDDSPDELIVIATAALFD